MTSPVVNFPDPPHMKKIFGDAPILTLTCHTYCTPQVVNQFCCFADTVEFPQQTAMLAHSFNQHFGHPWDRPLNSEQE